MANGNHPEPIGENQMADLRNGETSVDVTRNESVNGDSGRRKRSASSAYLLAGGSKDTYSVTVNFDSGHFCKVDGGEPCKGNLFGKKGKYGAINARDTNQPEAWCKHVQAALSNVEQITEAQEITAVAFGKAPREVTVKVKAPVKAFEPKVESAADRLAKLEAEAEGLRETIASEAKSLELRDGIHDLVRDHGFDAVLAAVKVA
jgi:hypothetical protein